MREQHTTTPNAADVLLLNAVDVLMKRWKLSRKEAAAALRRIARQTETEINDLAALVVGTSHHPRMVGSL